MIRNKIRKNFDLVKTSFAKLSNNERLISEVVKVVQQKLLPSLNPNPTGVESLRLYLLLPELIRGLQEQQRTELTGALASKILQLNPADLKVLEMYWSKLPDDYLKNLVDLLKKESAILIDLIAFGPINWDIPRRLQKLVQILHMVYKACCNTNRHIAKTDFIIHKIIYLHYVVLYKEDVSKRTAVNKKDFFLNVFQELCAPESQILMYNDNNTVSWFPTKPSVEKEKYFLFGTLCGLAFNNNSVVNLPFPLALFKKLLNVKPSLQDLIEFSPVLGKSLRYILDYSDDVEEMDMNFTITWDGTEVELDPAEPGKIVTNYNRIEFVDKYVDYILNKSVEEVFEEFKRGFFSSCDRCLVEMFEPEELRGVLVGNEEYDWDILKQNTTYEGSFYAEHPTIISFWEVFDELTPNEKKAFLLFLTGFEKVPILGMSAVKMRVTPLFNSTQDHLPEALTCYALLELPVYQNKETLRAKVIEAINHKRGFWEE